MTANTLLFLLALALSVQALPKNDEISSPPGMSQAVVYSGYLDTLVPSRKIHYIFVQANSTGDLSKMPLTIWLNGGPGCSSLIGMLQQIGPFLVGDDYTMGDNLNPNAFSWNRASHLLFLQSPAIVGFSTDTNPSFEYDDEVTAVDCFAAVKDFLFTKAIQFQDRSLFIAGESYAGKYIPDLATKIIENNRYSSNKYINFKGILVGNGVMTFEKNSLSKSQISFMMGHDFISSRLENVYKSSCSKEYSSPRCQFFRYEFDVLRSYLNHYNVYEVCEYKTTESLRLLELLSTVHQGSKGNGTLRQKKTESLGELKPCPSDLGMTKYWNLNSINYKTNFTNKNWAPCARLRYTVSEAGSMDEYRQIVLNKAVKVWLFSGDWDDVVPYTDTEKNVDLLNRKKVGTWDPWFTGDVHAGFYQIYEGNFTVVTVKGAGHMVPSGQPRASYQMFYNFVNNLPINSPAA